MTFSSAELLDALRRRRRKSLRPQAPGEFPPGWAAWFASMREHVGAITGATADAIIAIFLAREPASPSRASVALNRWQAFNTLWRQQWQPVGADGRGIRVLASVITVLVHLLLALFLMYLAYVRFMGIPEEQAAQDGEEVIQVEFIGDGTPDAQGGGPPQAETTTEPVPAPPANTSPPAQAAAPAAPPPPPSAVQPAPSPAPPTVEEQPLQVTETPVPDQSFVVPPPPIEVPQIAIPAPDLGAPSRAVQVVDIPAPVQPVQTREVAPRTVPTPDLQVRPAEVAVRDVPAPIAPVQVRDIPTRPTPAPVLSTTTSPQVTRRDVPTPPGPPQESPTTQPSPSQTSSTTAPATNPAPAAGERSANNGNRPSETAAGSGATPAPTPGASPATKRGDDWGASDRNRPGGQAGKSSGLFNPDGSPKLAGDGKVGGGLPPGTITEDFAKIDRNGTWLKRPPTDYTPTSFDRFWVPSETLLQEWVRKSIKEVLIPIPGTSKTIKCSVVLLALGGACNISDPNMQDVEAEARKPPDIPFKPELQEDQDALKKK